MSKRKNTVLDIVDMKQRKELITMLTAYDYPMANILDEAGIDMLLVGDSMGMVVQGLPTTLPVTIDDTIRATQAVSRGATTHSLIVGDMPFMSFGVSIDSTIENAGRLIKEGGAEAVKLEGGRERVEEIQGIIDLGIPVMGHVGMTPTYLHRFGGYKVQGKTEVAAERMKEDAAILEETGAFSIVLECIPWQLGKEITESLTIPTIGIGAGPHCDGQVLVTHDMLGLFTGFKPKFVKHYTNLRDVIKKAVSEYADEVRRGTYPDLDHSYGD